MNSLENICIKCTKFMKKGLKEVVLCTALLATPYLANAEIKSKTII